MKGNNKSAKSIITAVMAVLVIITIVVFLWRLKHIMDSNKKDVNIFANKSKMEEKTAYMIYKVDIEKRGKSYYIKFMDVVGDAARGDIKDEPHYFRIDFTFETSNKDVAELIKNNEKAIIESVRKMMGNLMVTSSNSEKVMSLIKQEAMRRAESIVGRGNILGIYYESFLSQ